MKMLLPPLKRRMVSRAEIACETKARIMDTPQWVADIHVDVALASELVRGRFCDLDVRSVTSFGNGWDNAAFLFNESLIFRFPRRAAFANLIETEAAVLPSIAGALPLAISAPTHVGQPSERYPHTFGGYPLIAGRTAMSVPLSELQRTALAVPLANFLRALHAIPVDALVARGLPEDKLGRLDHVKRRVQSQARFEKLRVSGHLRDDNVFLDWMDAHPPEPPGHGALRLVHGDLYSQHVILDETLLPVGVIDWGDMHLGNPGIDLAVAHLMLPATAHAQFIDAYGPIDECAWNAARYRAIYHALLELEYGVAEGDAGIRDAGLLALRMMEPNLD
jgi:aminoglycoside phosphotransferase (APT) family kinase protein